MKTNRAIAKMVMALSLISAVQNPVFAESSKEKTFEEEVEANNPGYFNIFKNFGNLRMMSCDGRREYGLQFMSSDNYALILPSWLDYEVEAYLDLYLGANGDFLGKFHEILTKKNSGDTEVENKIVKTKSIFGKVHVLKSGQVLLPGLGVATQISFYGKPALRFKFEKDLSTAGIANKSVILQVKRIHFKENTGEEECLRFLTN